MRRVFIFDDRYRVRSMLVRTKGHSFMARYTELIYANVSAIARGW